MCRRTRGGQHVGVKLSTVGSTASQPHLCQGDMVELRDSAPLADVFVRPRSAAPIVPFCRVRAAALIRCETCGAGVGGIEHAQAEVWRVTVLADMKGDVLMFMRRAARAPLSKVLA